MEYVDKRWMMEFWVFRYSTPNASHPWTYWAQVERVSERPDLATEPVGRIVMGKWVSVGEKYCLQGQDLLGNDNSMLYRQPFQREAVVEKYFVELSDADRRQARFACCTYYEMGIGVEDNIPTTP